MDRQEDASVETSKLRYRVSGMDCPSCVGKLETALRRIPQIKSVKVSFQTQNLSIEAAANEDVDPEVTKVVQSLGFAASREASEVATLRDGGASSGSHDLHSHGGTPEAGPWWKQRKGRLVIGIGAVVAVAFAASHLFPSLSRPAYILATAIGLIPFARRAFALTRSGTPFSIETLMSVAAVGAIAIGAYSEAAIVVFLFAVGELLESVAAGKSRAGIQKLISLVPRTALIEESGKTREVPASELKIGDVVLVRPGDRVPTDGEIIDGESQVDESPVTGESTPVSKARGDEVFAGSINANALLRINVTKTATDNTIARIIHMVEEAQATQAPMARFIDRFSAWYTPAAMVVTGLVIIAPPLLFGEDWYTWLYRGLALLLIACPCALVLSTPATIASGIAAGARRGLLIKGGAALEMLGKVKTVAFDKTGTLTIGRPKVTDVIPLSGTVDEILAEAAAVEAGSSHPIARAVMEEATAKSLVIPTATDAIAVAGKAVVAKIANRTYAVGSPRYALELSAENKGAADKAAELEKDGKTVVMLLQGVVAKGLIAVQDQPRDDAKAGIAALRRLRIDTVMLTGDNKRTGSAIAAKLGMNAVSELLPDDKLAMINRMKEVGGVAMVGDGINDAPALAAASVGIAMGGGTDVALETADAALLKNSVMGVPELLELSRKTVVKIKENIAISIGLKVAFLGTTMFGVTTLWMAILADTGATVLVTLNALMLLQFNPRKQAL